MTQTIKHIKARINSIDNTKKTTSAMELISRTKYQRTIEPLNFSKFYLQEISSIVSRLGSGSLNPFFEIKKSIKKIGLCVVASDSGLCSTYNIDVLNVLDKSFKNHKNTKIFAVGKKSVNYFKQKEINTEKSYVGFYGKLSDELLNKIVKDIEDVFTKKEIDELYVVYTKFHSTAKTEPVIEKILPIEKPNKNFFYIEESKIETILENVLPNYILAKIKNILLESFVSEHVSRMIAMKTATDNAKELLESLILTLNKTRQALITREIIEIISSAEAMK